MKPKKKEGSKRFQFKQALVSHNPSQRVSGTLAPAILCSGFIKFDMIKCVVYEFR